MKIASVAIAVAIAVFAGIPFFCFAQTDQELDEKLRSMARENGLTNFTITPEIRSQARKLRDIMSRGTRDFLEKTQGPITFYGRVVDEHERPVPAVEVVVEWNDLSAYMSSLDEKDVRRKSLILKSDLDGSFHVDAVVAPGLEFSVSMPGFYSSRRNLRSISYSESLAADRNRPVVFHLQKKGPGTDLITSQYGVLRDFEFSAPRNGTPVVVDFFNRKLAASGQLQLSQVQPEYLQAKQAKSWSFRMEIPDGGFVEQSDEFPFEAPEAGYRPVVQFDFKLGETNWTVRLSKKYDIAFGEPRRYGWLKVEAGFGWGGARLQVRNQSRWVTLP